LIDCNNREIPEGYAFDPILGESLAEAGRCAGYVVKAFNTFAQVFELSPEPLKNITSPVLWRNRSAKKTVMSLAEEIGFLLSTVVHCVMHD